MTITPEKLRRLAKASPVFAADFNAAANEIDRLNSAIETWGDVDLNKKEEAHGVISFTLSEGIEYKVVRPFTEDPEKGE